MTVAHVVGIDPGIVHTGVVSLRFTTATRTLTVHYTRVDGLNARAVRDWLDQFPVFPPEEFYPQAGDDYTVSHKSGTLSRPVDDTFDAFHAARSWFGYANTVVPPTKKDRSGQPLPWASPRPGEYDQFRYRLNDRQAKVIERMFREGPDGFKGGLSAENYIAITGTSRATTTRDLQDLVEMGALNRTGERRHTRYWLEL